MSAKRPETPPPFCSHCPKPAPEARRVPVRTEWHCHNPQCLWTVCLNCRKLTDVTGLIGQEPQQ